MKNFKLFEKLWEHSRTLKRVGLVLVMCLITITHMWGGQDLWNGYIKVTFNGTKQWSDTYYEMYSGGPNASVGNAAQLGTLTGDFVITDFKLKFNTDWDTHKSEHQCWYNVDGSGGNNYWVSWGTSKGDGYPEKLGVNWTAASHTDPSGYHSVNVGFQSKIYWDKDNCHDLELKTYYFSYTVLPPAVSSFTVTPTGAISGSGTSVDPYIVPYGGDLKLTMSGSQGHSDANSSAKYYNTSSASSWTTQTYKTISNVTNTSNNSVTIKMCYENTSHSELHGTESTKTVYYKASYGVSVYKFQTKSSGLGTDKVPMGSLTTSNALSTLIGGTLTAAGTLSTNLKYNENSFNFNGGNTAYLQIGLNNKIKAGDVIRYRYVSGSGSVTLSVQTAKGTTTNQINLTGSSATNDKIQTVVITAAQATAFASLGTVYLVRTGSNTAYLDYFEILRPYTTTLDASTNEGKVNGNNTEVHYNAAGETFILPHATKASNRFKGWFTTAGGSSEASNPYAPAAATTTLYAQFETCASIASGTVYKFQVKTGLTNEAVTSNNVDFEFSEGNYLSELTGGTLSTGGSKAGYVAIANNNSIQLGNNGSYLKVDLDCAFEAGDTIIATVGGTKGITIKDAASDGTLIHTIDNGTKVKVVVDASLVGEKTFYIFRYNSNTGAITYFEVKRPAKYTVSYNNGGGSGTMTSHSVVKGADQALTANTFTKNGYTFSCWHADVAVKVGGSTISAGGDISDGATLQAISGNVTLTAQWTCTTPTFGTNLNTTQVDYAKDDTPDDLEVAATANSGTVTYQWYSNDENNTTTPKELDSETEATYTPSTAAAGTTYYYCVATNTTDECSVSTTSNIAKIVVTACTEPTTTFADGDYTIGGSALDLRDLISADATSEGAITFAVTDANGTGATIAGDGYSFSATTAGTCTVTATQAADETNYYCSKEIDATITVSNPTYSVTYKANNSTAESDVVRGTESTFASNSTTSFTAPSTKAFAGWNTKADGSGTHYDVGDAVPSAITVYAEWWYKVYYIASSTSESNDITAALEDAKFAVSVKATTGTSYNASDYSDYALVVLSESLSGGDAATDGHELKVIVGLDKPILNLKTYFYGADGDASKRWKWGAPNAGKKPKCIYVKNSKYANLTSHPIYSGLTPDGSDSIQILKTPLTTKPIQPIGSFTSGKEGYTLALVPNNSSGSGTAIHEMTAAQRSTATGETITSKYLMISIQAGELSNLSDNGKKLIKNAADYLITGSQWVPQYKITHSSAINGDYTIQVGVGSATDDDTMSAAGTTITLDDDPDSGFELDSWTVTGDVSRDNITVTSNQFIMPAEAVTVAATFVASCTDPGLAYATGSVTKTLCDGSFTNTLTNNHSVAVTYTSSNTSVADVASDGAITIKAAGSTTITASSIAQTVSAVDYCADEASYTLTVSASTAAGLAYGTSTVKKDVGDDAFTNSLTNSNSLEVTYTSSDEDVATIDSDGEVTIKAAGTTTITASSAQQKITSTCYAAGSATYSLTVYNVYTVTYKAMGGTCATSSDNTSLGKVTLPSASHDDYTTYTWVEEDGTEAGDAGDNYEPSGNVTLYAKWQGSCAGGGGGSTTIYAMHMTAYNSYSNDESTTGTTTLAFADDNIVAVSDVNYYKPNSTNAIIVDFSASAYTLQAGDVITFYCVSNNASEKNVGFTIHATSSGAAIGTANVNATNKARVAASYTVVAETALVGVNKIWCNRVGAETRFHDMTITRGGSTCYTVTYDGNGATSGYVNDPEQYPSGTTVYTAYNSSITGFKRTGYEFNGWNTKADGSGDKVSYFTITADTTLYAQWRYLIDSNNEDFEGYDDAPTQYQDVRVTKGAKLTLTKSTNVHDITVETGSTLHVSTNGGSAITLATNSLSLVGGWGTVGSSTKYDMPRVYVDPASKITKTVKTINFDIAVDNRNFYPIAVPFPVTVSDVDYADAYLASYSLYGKYGQYIIKTYDGQVRANYGGISSCWKTMNDGVMERGDSGTEPTDVLEPGTGYILRALPANAGGWHDDYAIIRFPMKNVDDEWTNGGEKGSITVAAVTTTKNVVPVTAYLKQGDDEDAGDKTPNANKGWNILGVPYMSCYTTSSSMGTSAVIKGKFNYETNKWESGDIRYVTVPTHDFSEYIQEDIEDNTLLDDDPATVLLPGWCFFVQIGTTGNLTFLAADEAESTTLPYRVKNEDAPMPTLKTGIILSGNGVKDKTNFLISDKYSAAEYEINADLEKMFGENGYTLATYSLFGETRFAYNAMSNADAANIIPIGYRAPEEGEYTFSINPRYAENGAFESVNLIDYETGMVTDLLLYSYTFSTERTQNDARFALNVVPRQETPTGIENGANGANDANGVRKLLINGQLFIILDGMMYDATGKAVK